MKRYSTTERRAREVRLFKSVLCGSTWKTAGDAEGISLERARQIVNHVKRAMLHPSRLSGDVVPDHSHHLIAEVRRCADFWLKQLTKWERL